MGAEQTKMAQTGINSAYMQHLKDASYPHDTCQKFYLKGKNGEWYILWVDHKNPPQREVLMARYELNSAVNYGTEEDPELQAVSTLFSSESTRAIERCIARLLGVNIIN